MNYEGIVSQIELVLKLLWHASSWDDPYFSDIEDRNFFQSVHNVVYFAVGVLDKQAE